MSIIPPTDSDLDDSISKWNLEGCVIFQYFPKPMCAGASCVVGAKNVQGLLFCLKPLQSRQKIRMDPDLMDPSFLLHQREPRPAEEIKYGIITAIMLGLSIILFNCSSQRRQTRLRTSRTCKHPPNFPLMP